MDQPTVILFLFQNANNNYVGCVPRTNDCGAWDAPYDSIIDLEMELQLVNSTVSQSDQGMQCKAKSGEKAEFTCSK